MGKVIYCIYIDYWLIYIFYIRTWTEINYFQFPNAISRIQAESGVRNVLIPLKGDPPYSAAYEIRSEASKITIIINNNKIVSK